MHFLPLHSYGVWTHVTLVKSYTLNVTNDHNDPPNIYSACLNQNVMSSMDFGYATLCSEATSWALIYVPTFQKAPLVPATPAALCSQHSAAAQTPQGPSSFTLDYYQGLRLSLHSQHRSFVMSVLGVSF